VKTWVKLYTEIIRDADIGTLTWAQRGVWSAMLALAGELDARDEDGSETGALDTPERVAWHLRLSADELSSALGAFIERGMVDERDGVLYLTHYADRQSRAPSDKTMAVTERVKRHRAQVKRGCNEDVTSVKRGVTASDSDTETDTEADTEVSASPERGAEPAPAPNRRSDPRSKHPAIVAARAATGARHYPPLELYDGLISALGDSPDAERLKTCREAWVTRGYNPNAWTWATEWYVHGVPANGARASPGGNGNGRPTGKAAIEAYLRRGDSGVT